MALVVEDGTGLANADSLASLAFALAYLASIGDDRWTAPGVDDPKREVALRVATAEIRDRTAGRLQGVVVNLAQAQPFPRVGMVDAEGRLVASDSVPRLAAEACCDLAAAALSEDLAPDVASGDGGLVSKSVQLGPIAVSKTFAGATDTSKHYTVAERKLAQFLEDRRSRVERG